MISFRWMKRASPGLLFFAAVIGVRRLVGGSATGLLANGIATHWIFTSYEAYGQMGASGLTQLLRLGMFIWRESSKPHRRANELRPPERRASAPN